jgi:isopenicillin N synthase-like dioxygenase
VVDTFIVNIADLVQTFTNNPYIATTHRVINTSGNACYSMPFFIDLDYDGVWKWFPPASRRTNLPSTSPIPVASTK